MGSEKAWYWIAVGALALFVGNNFAARQKDGVRCLASRSMAAVEQVSGGANRLMAMAEMMLGRGETHFARTQTAVASLRLGWLRRRPRSPVMRPPWRGFRPSMPEWSRCDNCAAQ